MAKELAAVPAFPHIERTFTSAPRISLVVQTSSEEPSARLDAGQQFHQVSDLDGFERTRGAVDLASEALVETAGHELVELLDSLFPCEGVGSEARVARPFVVPDCGLIQFRVPWSAYLASDGLTVGLDLLPESFGALL
jgi:hypothetical protein